MLRSGWVLFAPLVVLAILEPAAGEVFLLHSGGRVEGDLINADEKPRSSYIISLPNGGQLTLDAAVVDQVQPVRPELAEYEKARRKHPDTVQGQLQMADWCRDNNLPVQRKTHLERVLRLDPDQADARRTLGYRKVKDKWMTQDEEMADKGYVKREGRWMTQQDAELRDSRNKQRTAEVEWVKKIRTYRDRLDGKQSEEVAKKLRAINDPMAIFALTERLVKKRDPRTDARLMYVEALARINTHEARGPLAICAIDDPVEEVRLSCLDELEKQKDEGVTAYFVGRMRDKHTSNAVINRAGVALGRIKDPSCIEALIQYLMTIHEEVLPAAGGPGSMTSTFSKNGGGGGLSMNQKPQKISRLIQNQGVLDALVAITGQNFGYDDRAWRTWYTNQKLKGAPVVAPPK
jgi:hypothetical protein